MKETNTLPVSRNAHKRFIERINMIVMDYYDRQDMLAALEQYLAGDRVNYARYLSPELAMAFEMLRFEIDAAIVRSTRARARAAKRRDARSKQPTEHPCPNPHSDHPNAQQQSCQKRLGEPRVRVTTLEAIAESGDPRNTPCQKRLGEPTVRVTTLEAIAESGDRESIPPCQKGSESRGYEQPHSKRTRRVGIGRASHKDRGFGTRAVARD